MSETSGTATGPVRTTAFPHTATAKVQNSEQSGASTGGGGPRTSSGGRPRTAAARPAGRGGGPRRVRLAVSRVDPWSVMKLAFLMSIAIGIGLVVASAVVWWVLNEMEVFAQIRGLLEEAEAMAQFGPLLEYLEFSRVMSVATVIAIIDIALLTALATLGAFVYNIVAAMVGGLHLTLTDD